MHLSDYEEAATEKGKALAAIEVVSYKNSRRLAWQWADIAVVHARKAGIEDAGYLVSGERYPEMGELKERLQAMP